ncbi:cerebellin 20 [Myxocyprinus asiaticus]|uniref:cerebellin 20 n=1 Tax=Myxocyprinus asiaticus TaxID=70543 RepID=UPI002223351C|nr:cerebellin 20 [Myxocyprinus asiaticus]
MKALVIFTLLVCALAQEKRFSWNGPGETNQTDPNVDACMTDTASCGCCLMQNQIWKLEMFFNLSLNELQTGLERAQSVLNNIRASRSAFSVALTDTRLCVGPNREDSVVKYASVLINLGDVYNTSTGVFVAPRSGVYNLALTVYSDAGTPGARITACARLRLNGRTLKAPSENNLQDQEDSVSAVLAVQLHAGDHVDVALPAGCFLCDDNNHYNTFTGFLLYATD